MKIDDKECPISDYALSELARRISNEILLGELGGSTWEQRQNEVKALLLNHFGNNIQLFNAIKYVYGDMPMEEIEELNSIEG